MKPDQLKKGLVYKFALLMGLVLFFGACSTKQAKQDDGLDSIPAAIDAGTDAVPQPTAETPPPPPPVDAAVNTPVITPSDQLSGPPKPSVSQSQPETYSVKNGDTLMKIAFEVYGDIFKWKEIYESNKDKISNPNSIPEGVVLNITPPGSPVQIDQNGEKYLIKKGDTLGKIADALYGSTAKWKALWKNNKQLIQNPNKIFAGFYLYYAANSSISSDSTSPAKENDASVAAVQHSEPAVASDGSAPVGAESSAPGAPVSANNAPGLDASSGPVTSTGSMGTVPSMTGSPLAADLPPAVPTGPESPK